MVMRLVRVFSAIAAVSWPVARAGRRESPWRAADQAAAASRGFPGDRAERRVGGTVISRGQGSLQRRGRVGDAGSHEAGNHSPFDTKKDVSEGSGKLGLQLSRSRGGGRPFRLDHRQQVPGPGGEPGDTLPGVGAALQGEQAGPGPSAQPSGWRRNA
jgi:hypothetical protein